MDVVSVVETVIKDHPFVDFDYEASGHEVHWCLCPCGFSTKHYKTERAAHKAFKAHITDEVNEALVEASLLKLDTQHKPSGGLPSRPVNRMLTSATV